jgi:hypothetical protein
VKAHKFLSMTREEQVEAIAEIIDDGAFYENPNTTARAVLATIYGEAKP